MASYQVSISDESICKRTLEWLRDHSEINANGIVQVERSIDGMGANQVIINVVNFDPAIPDGTKLRVIQQTLTQWRQVEKFYNADNLVGTFKQVLSAELQNLEKQESSFTILAFLNIEQRDIESLFPLTLQGSKLQLPTWHGLQHLRSDKLWDEAKIHLKPDDRAPLLKKIITTKGVVRYLIQRQTFIPITIELKAIDANTALYTAVDSLDFFRAVLNLPPSLSLFRRYGPSVSSLSKFLSSPLYGVFRHNGEYETLFYTSESHSYKRQRITEDYLGYCSDLLDDLKDASPGDLKYLLVKAIKLYQQAFDFTEYQATYLGLWQLLEVLTLNEPSHGRTQVDKRIACLLGLQGDDVLSNAIKVLVKSRNTLVHSGLFPDYADGLVFTLKGIIDEMLKRIMYLSDHLTTESELREYYRLISKSDADLKREAFDLEITKKAIKFIQNSRSKN